MRHILFAGTSAAAALALLGSSAGACAQGFGAKPGAWENTITVSGIVIPPDVLAKMPPERRAMVEQQTGANGGRGQPQVRRTCVTKEMLEKGFTANPDSSCTAETVTRSSTKLAMKTTCTAPIFFFYMSW